MMSRITLNLKKFGHQEENQGYRSGTGVASTMTWPASIASRMIPQFFKGTSKKVDPFGFGGTSSLGRWGVPDTGTMAGHTDTMELRTMTIGHGKVVFDDDEEEDDDRNVARDGDKDTTDRAGVTLNHSRV